MLVVLFDVEGTLVACSGREGLAGWLLAAAAGLIMFCVEICCVGDGRCTCDGGRCAEVVGRGGAKVEKAGAGALAESPFLALLWGGLKVFASCSRVFRVCACTLSGCIDSVVGVGW